MTSVKEQSNNGGKRARSATASPTTPRIKKVRASSPTPELSLTKISPRVPKFTPTRGASLRTEHEESPQHETSTLTWREQLEQSKHAVKRTPSRGDHRVASASSGSDLEDEDKENAAYTNRGSSRRKTGESSSQLNSPRRSTRKARVNGRSTDDTALISTTFEKRRTRASKYDTTAESTTPKKLTATERQELKASSRRLTDQLGLNDSPEPEEIQSVERHIGSSSRIDRLRDSESEKLENSPIIGSRSREVTLFENGSSFPTTPRSSAKRRSLIDTIEGGSPRRKLFPALLRASPVRSADQSARRKAVRNIIANEDDELDETVLAGASPKKNLLKILDDQGSKALFLDGPEGYFEQHRVREKISKTRFDDVGDLPYLELKRHVLDEAKSWEAERHGLEQKYRNMFNQWNFEISMGFSLAFYGVGSKRDLLNEFALLLDTAVLVVNGYNPDTSIREILKQVATAFFVDEVVDKLPKTPADALGFISHLLQEDDFKDVKLNILIHNIDGEALRGDKDQIILGRLAALQQITIIASMDHAYAPMLWDASKLVAYKFVWHDITTYSKYTVETSFDNQLTLGKDSSSQAAKGAQYVLASLTENSRKLYHLLLCHQMETMMEIEVDDRTVASALHGMEYKLFYNKCVEEFIASNELNFRTMLKEFIEHKMIESRKDAGGNETLYIPFTKEAVENMVEELS